MNKAHISNCEKNFLLTAIGERKRIDGRQFTQYRDLKISFEKDRGCCLVSIGNTRVMAQISASVESPKQSRPTEGLIFVNVELSPMAAPHFEAGRQSDQCVEIMRILERCIKESRCVDTESLCIMAGVKVWSIRADLHVLNHDGNLIDACSIAAISALAHFRRPDVSVSGEDITIHSVEDRDPVPLSVHHMPICVTFAFYDEGRFLLVDPTFKEEQVEDGKMVIGMNKHREICTLQMTGSMLLLKDQILRCSNIAVVKVQELTELLQTALENDTEARAQGKKSGFATRLREKLPIKTPAMDLGNGDEEEDKGMDIDSDFDMDAEFENDTKEEFESLIVKKTAKSITIGEGGANSWGIQAAGDTSTGTKRSALKLPAPKKTEESPIKDEEEEEEEEEATVAKMDNEAPEVVKPLKAQKGRFIGSGGHIDLKSALKAKGTKP